MLKFGYTIIYVEDVPSVLKFYRRAFGFETRFLHEDQYGELQTGETVLGFASHVLGQGNLPEGYTPISAEEKPAGVELAFVTEDVQRAYDRAVAAGAVAIAPPKQKPWGQTVGYVRSMEGTVVEICSPVG